MSRLVWRPTTVEIEETSRCSGHCCERFYLPYSPERLALIRELHQERRDTGTCGQREPPPGEVDWVNAASPDNDEVPFMVRHVERSFIGADGQKIDREHPADWYTCIHFKNQQCTIYDERPKMCQDFPGYGDAEKPCEYPQCTRKTKTVTLYPLKIEGKSTLGRLLKELTKWEVTDELQ